MADKYMEQLGRSIAALRVARQLKQSELAYEAGVSERTLQRIEAGEVVKTDGLLKVVRQLGRIDELLAAVAPALSPNQLARQAKRGAGNVTGVAESAGPGPSSAGRKTRVRRSAHDTQADPSVPKTIVWPEDQS